MDVRFVNGNMPSLTPCISICKFPKKAHIEEANVDDFSLNFAKLSLLSSYCMTKGSVLTDKLC